MLNTNNVYNGSKGGPSYSAYMTFSNPRESANAILVSTPPPTHFSNLGGWPIHVQRQADPSLFRNIEVLPVFPVRTKVYEQRMFIFAWAAVWSGSVHHPGHAKQQIHFLGTAEDGYQTKQLSRAYARGVYLRQYQLSAKAQRCVCQKP